MLNTLIIDDERPAAESLMTALASVADTITITAQLHSVRESIDYLSHKPAVDLIFSDIHLSDGLCFGIFKQDRIGIPVIFVTGNDEFIINAFDCNGIDYLLKPVDTTDLHKAIAKYRMLCDHFNDHPAILPEINHSIIVSQEMAAPFREWMLNA